MVLSVEYFILIFSDEVAFDWGCNDYICSKALFSGYCKKAVPQQKKISVRRRIILRNQAVQN